MATPIPVPMDDVDQAEVLRRWMASHAQAVAPAVSPAQTFVEVPQDGMVVSRDPTTGQVPPARIPIPPMAASTPPDVTPPPSGRAGSLGLTVAQLEACLQVGRFRLLGITGPVDQQWTLVITQE